MRLAAGTRLGPYEIVKPIGAGGMGEVYRAHDTRLDRAVAIKISFEKFTKRFEQEARSIAALNHFHICQLYDVGENYLVMELIEGAPLKGPLPLEKAVEYAGQILDALDAAHAKGITHRDLKPANVLVAKSGIKLLDFGLAKQAILLSEQDATRAVTEQGQIVGTLQYMSPEQLQGKPFDSRSDLFSFGCVFYEMLTGERAFPGTSAATVIAAILERQPASVEIARPVDRVLRRALAKDPEQRFQTARDLKAALGWAMEQPPAGVANPKGTTIPWAVAGLLALALVGSSWITWRANHSSKPKPLVRLDVDLGPEVDLPIGYTPANLAQSPDGSRLVYISGRSRFLYSRRLDQAQSYELPGTVDASLPSFSPDGQWITFFTRRGLLNKISVEGGAVIPLAHITDPGGASWGSDGNLIVAQMSTELGLFRIPGNGGSSTPILAAAQADEYFSLPQILPGGKAVLFSRLRGRSPDANCVEAFSLADRARKTLVQGGANARYLPTGHLVYTIKGTLFAIPFDLARLETRGAPVPVLDDVAFDPAD